MTLPQNSKEPTSAALAQSIAKAFLSSPSARWAGLAARDSLRLEAGMCLYGHDIDTSVTPGMAALGWVVAKNRRDNPGEFFNSAFPLQSIEWHKRETQMGCARSTLSLAIP